MKFQLLSTSLALLGASAVSGQKQLRGIQHQQLSVYDHDGRLREGRRAAEKLWRDMGGDCANAWRNFKTSINREIKNRGWKTNSYNDGARKGMQEVLHKYEKKCFHDSPDEAPECIYLGNEAASMIAENFCFDPIVELDYESYGTNCRKVAIDQCKGQVYGKVRSYCGSQKSGKSNVIDHFQNQCSMVIKIKSMIGDNAQNEELFFMED